jgi:hypothetical protein
MSDQRGDESRLGAAGAVGIVIALLPAGSPLWSLATGAASPQA